MFNLGTLFVGLNSRNEVLLIVESTMADELEDEFSHLFN